MLVVGRGSGRLKVFRLASEVRGDLVEGHGSPEDEHNLGAAVSVRVQKRGVTRSLLMTWSWKGERET